MRDAGAIKLEVLSGSKFEKHDHAYELMFIDDYPVFVDLRDDFTIDKNLFAICDDFLLLKSNFSSELWDMAQRSQYPDGVEYTLDEDELKYRSCIRPFVLGRTFTNDVQDEFEFAKYIKPVKHKVVSASGVGILSLQSQTRLKVYDLFDKILGEKSKLIYFDRDHFAQREYVPNLDYYLKKYVSDCQLNGFDNYVGFLSTGEYSINFPGIALSTPFRFVDGVISNRCCISTKIWHDIYASFPCVQLPICGYLGTGDWVKAEEILRDLDKVDYTGVLQQSKEWYNKYLSASGMWENQFLKYLD